MANEQQDVYPLGQGGGLLKDILNFALNNVYQYGQRLGNDSSRVSRGLENVRAGRPSGLGASEFQPLIGPNVVGQISPSNWANYSPEAKAILTETFNKFPRLFERVQKTPANLHVRVVDRAEMPNYGGMQKSINPYFDEIALAKRQRMEGTQSNRGVGDTLNWRSIPSDQLKPDVTTTVHELQHHINQPKMRTTDPADLATIGTLLNDIMYNKDVGSLTERLGQYKAAALDKTTWNKPIMSPHRVEPTSIPGHVGFGKEPWSQFLGGAIGDEGLAYLSQYAPHDPSLARLAESLGVNPGAVPTATLADRLNKAPLEQVPSLMDEVWNSINQMRNKLSGGEY